MARSRFERFRAAHPGLRVDLLVDQPPGSPEVDYDVLLQDGDRGTVALSWRADSRTPWSVVYADHWASNYVLSVNDNHVTVQQAVLFFKLVAGERPDLMTELVDQALVSHAIGKNPPDVDDEELQAAAETFRGDNELHTADDLARWLKETGLTTPRLQALLAQAVHRRRLEDRVTSARVQAYFQAHRKAFETVQVFRVETADDRLATRLGRSARKTGLLAAVQRLPAGADPAALTGALLSRYAMELSGNLTTARVGTVIGPVREDGALWIAELLRRRPARLDVKTRAAIRQQLFRDWLAEQRARATVRWHWME